MQFTKSLLLLAAFTGGALARAEGHARRQATTPASTPSSASGSSSGGAWTATPSGPGSTAGFGGSTSGGGSGATYQGNIGNPYGSNIIEVSESDASSYEYVIQFKGQNTEDWTVVVWNKYSSDGTMDGFFGKATTTFTLSPGATKYLAIDGDSQGGWAAAPGSTVPTGSSGIYAATWGEFDFGSTSNNGWSGFDVSAIQAQNNGLEVQGMQICDALGTTCSSISPQRGAQTDVGGIGGNLASGPVRLVVTIAYSG
ncbi:hypothetical protein N7468_008948 [Penicillium chermesinum]|uniref:Allergen Asp f 4 n=1 Tax=Penicillium chermesinum TaxID=63820 RepID=A0A9W9NJF0_9EURO|nr:uncharacterized protein N7468_008948 [Penicillium chermesinum]KAJ5219744.1 hypothetical protein N7468_008948 [Penicillium chermesinum]